MQAFDHTIKVETIVSGKFRRYHQLALWRQLLRPVTIVWPNIRDVFKVGVGIIQSLVKLIIWRPDVVFAKGGYVCLPIGIAAHLLRIPLVIHDSDAHPGLTNRVLSRWAAMIATGAPLKYYNYPASKARYVGIPVSVEARMPTADERRDIKRRLNLPPDSPLVVITGGGLGARRINNAVAVCLPRLLEQMTVVLVAGAQQYEALRAELGADTATFQLHPFVSNLTAFMQAADVVVARAGMTTLAELAAMGKPTILVPNAHLTGGHQLKNAKVYLDADAAEMVKDDMLESSPEVLERAVIALIDDTDRQATLASNFHTFAKPSAARDVADVISQVLSSQD